MKEKILIGIFHADVFILVLNLFTQPYGLDLKLQTPLGIAAGIVPALFIFLYLIWVLSLKRTMLFFFIASAIGFIAEVVGLQSGVLFGGHYSYAETSPTLFHVPVLVIVYWALFIMAGYIISNSFLRWLGKKKPNKNTSKLLCLFLLIVSDGLIVTIADIFMDPLQVKAGFWIWLDNAFFYGVPLGNFLGWFVVTVLATGVFRLYEYYFPKQNEAEFSDFITLLPVISYGVTACAFGVVAVKYGLVELAVIGSVLMLGVVTLNVYLYIRRFST